MIIIVATEFIYYRVPNTLPSVTEFWTQGDLWKVQHVLCSASSCFSIDLLQNCAKEDPSTRVLFLAQCTCINLYCSKFSHVKWDITDTRVATTQQHRPCQVVTAAAPASCILMHAFYFDTRVQLTTIRLFQNW